MTDKNAIQRIAQALVVEFKSASGSPPCYENLWHPIFGAKVDRIKINRDGRPNMATIWFPERRWQESRGLLWGDMLRIRTAQVSSSKRTVLFNGFVTGYLSDFSGGTEQPRSAFERNAVVCSDYRWLLSATCPIYGQYARGPDDYYYYGTASQTPAEGRYTFLSGRRAIFNRDGRPDRDPVDLDLLSLAGTHICFMPLFADSSAGLPWTAGQMVRYILSPLHNKSYQYLPIDEPANLIGLDHTDWSRVLNHVVVDGLNVIEAIQTICRAIGWGLREDYDGNDVNLVFYKIGSASGYSRSSSQQTILHRLHAPAVGDAVTTAALAGRKLLWSMSLAEDIGPIVNNPLGLGAPHRFEFTAELMPGWLDSDFNPDTSDNNVDLFFNESQLQDLYNKDSKDFYKYYHPGGSGFLRDVGRKWVLNESGLYSNASTYDRGMPFDFSEVLPSDYIKSETGRKLFAPMNRRLLPCLTIDKDQLTSVGIKVEFSFDGGTTWQQLPCAIASLEYECGIYITEPNLAEIVEKDESLISGGVLNNIQLNYFTSLADDKVNSRSFKNDQWYTRIRVTASVQMDQRLFSSAEDPAFIEPTTVFGSPFHHSQIYDFSDKYGLQKRSESSSFDGGDLDAYEMDSSEYIDRHLQAVRQANEDMTISGRFTLERLWLGDGSGRPDFAIGDEIERITGRSYSLSVQIGGRTVHPEIIQIIYLPDQQKMQLITRDLRFADVLL